MYVSTEIVADMGGSYVERSDIKPMVVPNYKGPIAKATLPVHGKDVLPIQPQADVRAEAIAWLSDFSNAIAAGPDSFAKAFLPDGWWRDKVAFTWDYRTFHGQERIVEAAAAIFDDTKPSDFALLPGTEPTLETPYPDLSYIQLQFSFKTSKILGSGVVNLVCTPSGYRAWTVSTFIESLIDFPEVTRADGHMTGSLSWAEQREKQRSFEEEDPAVVIIGAGHNGLVLAARLQALGVKVLVVERNERVGDNWRKRYEALSLHFPVWQDHLPYIPFPKNWPTYTPAAKLGNWLESYVDALDLNVWLSSCIVGSSYDKEKKTWNVKIHRGSHGERTVRAHHLVIATGLAGVPNIPEIPGRDNFKGVVRHSSQHDSSKPWVGKKVLVVGTSSSGFDTAFDFSRRGIDVTMLQRSPTYIMSLTNSVPLILGSLYCENGPPLELADRLAHHMPIACGELLAQRMTEQLAELDKDLIDAMEAKGFRTYLGENDTGTVTLGLTRNGGFYYDAGGCQAIIDGKIKVEQGSIKEFTDDGVVLSTGKELSYDLVVLATGYTNVRDSIRANLSEDVAKRCKDIWGVDNEGEINGAWRNMGVDGLWVQVGTLGHARFHSKIVANQIKAMEEGVAGKRYED